jgi:hypothetical protein
MQEFKEFLATIYFAPSRLRNFDNSTPTNLPLPGFFGVDSNGVPDRTPLPNGNAAEGENRFINESLNGIFPLTMAGDTCTTCHNYRSGRGLEGDFLHVEREGGRVFRTAQLRSLSEKLGMDLRGTNSRAGFGFRFDGREATMTDLLVNVFRMTNSQAIADTTAFLLSFPGTQFTQDYTRNESKDSHAAVGRQFIVRDPADHRLPPKILEWTSSDEALDIIVRGRKDGLNRAWSYNRDTTFLSDRNGESASLGELLALATPDTPLIFTISFPNAGRAAIDRDGDGVFDQTETEAGLDPADIFSRVRIVRVEWNQAGGSNVLVSIAPPASHHRLQYKARLEDTMWTDLPDIRTADASTGWLTLFDRPLANPSQRFYRVVLVE